MKILLVEDQLAFANILVRSLDGLNIHHVETIAAAREWLNKNRADLILLDLGLSDSQGLDTLRAIKDVKVPKVVISGRYDITAEAHELGATDYVVKTTMLSDIVDRIMFNVSKIKPRKRLSEKVFGEIKMCFERERFARLELTTV